MKIDGAAIVFSAAPGEQNDVVLGDDTLGEAFFVIGDGSGPVTTQPPCVPMQFSETTAVCPTQGITSVQIDLGNRDDMLGEYTAGENTAKVLPLNVTLGEGNDRYSYLARAPMRVDGGPGDDIISSGGMTDVLLGGDGDDDLSGRGGRDAMDGADGDDTLRGGDGGDSLTPGTGRDFAGGNGGNDVVDWRNRERDKAGTNCDAGRDTVIQDAADKIVEYRQPGGSSLTAVESCERVKGQPAPAPASVSQLGKGPPYALAIELFSAFRGRLSLKLFEGETLIARGKTRYGEGTPLAVLKQRNEPSRKRFRATLVITNRDAGGRVGTSTRRITVGANL